MTRRTVLQTFVGNGINIRYAECKPSSGSILKGLVLCLHGWPESWYSWRHQLRGLAAEGYHVVAPDMRGYGGTSQPKNVEEYNIYTLAGDALSLLAHLNYSKCFLIGHDWGAAIGWMFTRLHPDVFIAYAALSVPVSLRKRADGRGQYSVLRDVYGDPNGPDARSSARFHYMLFNNLPEAARLYESNIEAALFAIYSNTNVDDFPFKDPVVHSGKLYIGGRARGMWERVPFPTQLPKWLPREDFMYYVDEFKRAGMEGGMMYYRTMDLNHSITKHFTQQRISVPAIFLGGSEDGVVKAFGGKENVGKILQEAVEHLETVKVYDKVGHWIQQEIPAVVNSDCLEFFERHLHELAGSRKGTPGAFQCVSKL